MRTAQISLLFVLATLFAQSSADANEQLDSALKQLLETMDQVAVLISEQKNHADAEFLGQAAKQNLEKGLAGQSPAILVKATSGYCGILVQTTEFQVWTSASNGRVTEHKITMY